MFEQVPSAFPASSLAFSHSPSSVTSSTSRPDSSSSSYDQTTYKRITISPEAVPFHNAPQRRQLEEVVNRCCVVICQVLSNSGNPGMGCLIGKDLLLTTHEILPDADSAHGFAYFFQGAPNSSGTVKMVKVPLDPNRYFFTSCNRVVGRGSNRRALPPSSLRLNFTIVALRSTPFLSTIQESALSILDKVSLGPESPICLIQCSEGGPDTLLQVRLQCSFGRIKKVEPYSLTYSASMVGRPLGTLGGVVIDLKGRLIALNHHMISKELHAGVLVNQIAAILERQTAPLKANDDLVLARPRFDRKIIGLPTLPSAYTGRDKELQFLHSILLGEGKHLSVIGKEGVGKKALVLKYIETHKEDYSLIVFISCGTVIQIEKRLLNLADQLNIPKGIPDRLLRLKIQLEKNEQRTLLIFDQVDDQQTLDYLNNTLPQRECNILLLSSHLGDSLKNFPQIPLDSFLKEEAVAFLLKALEGKDQDVEQASLLAEKLGYFPLALRHAAAFIASAEGSNIRSYLEDLNLLGEVPSLDREELIIRTTWKKNKQALLQTSQGLVAENLFYLFSAFASTPIPKEIVKPEEGAAIQLLKDYSLLEERDEGYVLHPLVQKSIRHELGNAYREYLLKALQTLHDCSKSWNLEDSATRRRFDPYIAHFESVVESAKEVAGADWNCIYPLLEAMWIYYQKNKKFESSKRIATSYLTGCEAQGFPPLKKATGLRYFGDSLWELGEQSEGLRLFQASLEIREELLGTMNQDTADCYHDIGLALNILEKYDEALTPSLQALNIRRKVLGETHPKTADCHFNVGDILQSLGRLKEALRYKQDALKIYRDALGETHNDTVNSYYELGGTMQKLGKHHEALSLTEKSLHIRLETLGENHPKTAASYHGLSTCFGALGRYTEALVQGKHALEIRKNLLGETNYHTAESYRNVGINLTHLHRNREALTYYQQALKLRIELHGEKHVNTADSYDNMGICLINLGKYDEALEYSRRGLELRKELLGEQHKDTLYSYKDVIFCLNQLGRYEEAKKYKKAKQATKESRGPQ